MVFNVPFHPGYVGKVLDFRCHFIFLGVQGLQIAPADDHENLRHDIAHHHPVSHPARLHLPVNPSDQGHHLLDFLLPQSQFVAEPDIRRQHGLLVDEIQDPHLRVPLLEEPVQELGGEVDVDKLQLFALR